MSCLFSLKTIETKQPSDPQSSSPTRDYEEHHLSSDRTFLDLCIQVYAFCRRQGELEGGGCITCNNTAFILAILYAPGSKVSFSKLASATAKYGSTNCFATTVSQLSALALVVVLALKCISTVRAARRRYSRLRAGYSRVLA